jgi:hypothetical protein
MSSSPHEKLPWLEIAASKVLAACNRADEFFPNEWQACMLEILLIPEVGAHWRAMSGTDLRLERHAGAPYRGQRDVADWSTVAGYVFREGERLPWNCVRSEGYNHHPGTAWNGIRRETFSNWVYFLYQMTLQLAEGKPPNAYLTGRLAEYKVRVRPDFPLPVGD